jgi:mRNA-degrading endonuclease RelE of RelBE toxin-antitoxin system
MASVATVVAPAGTVFVPRGFEWDRAISADDRAAIIEQLQRLPAWLDQQLGTDNLDIKKLADSDGLWRLRVGAYRAIFQILAPNVVLHRVFRRREDTDYKTVSAIPLVRSGEGLRTLVEDVEQPPPVPPSARPIVRPARRDVVRNPLSVFSDPELAEAGLSAEAIDALRRVPTELVPDRVLVRLGVDSQLIRLVAELWEEPGRYTGKRLSEELTALEEREAAARLVSDYSATSLVPLEDPRAFLALLDGAIEDWMVYLHPSQLGAVRRPIQGPSRVRGGAGTGKTVVALHRARHLANESGGEILLTTFVNNLPKVWERLLAGFPSSVRGRIRCRTVNQIAVELYRKGGGTREIAEEAQRQAVIRDVWADQRLRLGGLTELGLEEEFDHMIIGRGITTFEQYADLPRTGRGTPLSAPARAAVWDGYEDYALRMGKAKLTYWPELRRDALLVLRDGRASLRYEAVVADEAQDLGAAAVQVLAEISGGLPSPNLTLVGDGQQAIYPGGFSLLQMGIDVRGRATVLRTNWRNTYAIWVAAQAFIEGEQFDDLEEDVASARDVEESPLPMRDGIPPGLWVAGHGEEADLATEIIREAIEDLGVDPGDIGVLAPTNAQVGVLRSALQAAGVANRELSQYEGVHEHAVRVGTFHRAKGLEFKHVIVTGLSAAKWPPKRPGLDEVAQAEARGRDVRAAFVAMTRARDRLDVVVAGAPAGELEAAAWAFNRY